jgi:hypothetical protein
MLDMKYLPIQFPLLLAACNVAVAPFTVIEHNSVKFNSEPCVLREKLPRPHDYVTPKANVPLPGGVPVQELADTGCIEPFHKICKEGN